MKTLVGIDKDGNEVWVEDSEVTEWVEKLFSKGEGDEEAFLAVANRHRPPVEQVNDLMEGENRNADIDN